MINIAIIGSRSFKDYTLLRKTIVDYLNMKKIHCNSDSIKIISGGANGADKLGELFATEFGLETEIFFPDWNTHGRSAGFKRNITIVENSDIVFAFWDGQSKGTTHSVNLARKHKKDLILITFNIQIDTIQSNRIMTTGMMKKLYEK